MLRLIEEKIKNTIELQASLAKWRKEDKTVVFTNGCFDLLHYGHIHYLAEAKTLGDILIVGINSKNSVQQLKGKHRPINDDLTRQHVLASFFFVDAVVAFATNTPYQLIELVQPDVLVKGGDWSADSIVGSDIVLQKGGLVKSLPFIEGYSTTKIEEKIKRG